MYDFVRSRIILPPDLINKVDRYFVKEVYDFVKDTTYIFNKITDCVKEIMNLLKK